MLSEAITQSCKKFTITKDQLHLKISLLLVAIFTLDD